MLDLEGGACLLDVTEAITDGVAIFSTGCCWLPWTEGFMTEGPAGFDPPPPIISRKDPFEAASFCSLYS